MSFTLAYRESRVSQDSAVAIPAIPSAAAEAPSQSRAARSDRHEHFGTEEAALRRAAQMMPVPDWLDLRLFGPDGRQLASQSELVARLGGGIPARTETP